MIKEINNTTLSNYIIDYFDGGLEAIEKYYIEDTKRHLELHARTEKHYYTFLLCKKLDVVALNAIKIDTISKLDR